MKMQIKATATPTRLLALRRFALAITILNILGHTYLGFEQSHAQPIVCLFTTYSIELLLESLDAFESKRVPAFLSGGLRSFIDFLLPAHITGLAVGMLLYANDRLLPFVFASAMAICSKYVFRVSTSNGRKHFLNPSNFGITVTLLLFPSIGIAPPYMFTEGLGPVAGVLLPLLIITTGSMLNAKLTRRIPLICGWCGGFILQAFIRFAAHQNIFSILNAMTGVAFVLFTFYMLADPATTPVKPRSQLVFGLSVGLLYGALVMFHIVFGMFFSLTLVCIIRGGLLVFSGVRERSAFRINSRPYVLPGDSNETPPRPTERLYPV